jgi:hypothetical protein
MKTSEQLTVRGVANIIAVLSLLFTHHASSMSHHTGLFENSHACLLMHVHLNYGMKFPQL